MGSFKRKEMKCVPILLLAAMIASCSSTKKAEEQDMTTAIERVLNKETEIALSEP